MAIQIDSNGDIILDATTGLSVQVSGFQSLEQDAMSEIRCEQQSYFADDTYGRNPLVWKLPTNNSDKIADIKRIVTKYYQPQNIAVDSDGMFVVS